MCMSGTTSICCYYLIICIWQLSVFRRLAYRLAHYTTHHNSLLLYGSGSKEEGEEVHPSRQETKLVSEMVHQI